MSKRRGAAKPKPKSAASKPKDNSGLLEALKLYESKNYKKSLKLLEAILKKDSSYVDALALKGLDLYSTGETEEAKSYINNAISKIKSFKASPICCHILGIYMRSTKNYTDSIRWFQASLDNGSTNHQIYRDLSILQSQIGDFKAVLASRKKYWEAYMGYRANWTSLAVAQYINGERQQAINTLSQFEKLAAGKLSEPELYENSECIMYKNDIMYTAAESNVEKLNKVLKHLCDNEKDIFDKYAVLERKASILMKTGEFKEASKVYRALIKRNPDNLKYYKLLEVTLGISNDKGLKLKLYKKLATFYPKAEPPKYIPLSFIEDENYLRESLNEYVTAQLKRGVPATFSNIKPLYRQRSDIIPRLCEDIVTEFLGTLEASSDPSAVIWTNYYLSQHYLFVRNYPKAQEYIDKAIEHTPTMVELYILKGRILKHMGMLSEAAEALEEGRKLDLQDRFINCKTAKYYLRANDIEKAVEVVSLFTKNDDAVNGVKDLHLVEASWFIIEQAEAYNRLHVDSKKKLEELRTSSAEVTEEDENADSQKIKELEWDTMKFQGLSLKRYTAISKFYQQFEDDQLDFHSYCLRKGTSRAYLEMLDWGKSIYTKPIYVRAMKGASRLYFELNDTLKERNDSEIVPKKKSNTKNKKDSSLNKRKDQERKIVMAYPADKDNDEFGEKLSNSKKPLDDFLNVFFTKYNNQVTDVDKDYVLAFLTEYKLGKLALSAGAITKYSKIVGPNASIIGAMAIILALATRDDQPFEDIAKQVARKVLESDFSSIPINEVNSPDFNFIKYFKDNYKLDNVNALLLLDYFQLNKDDIKPLILKSIETLEPYKKIYILEYEL
ncbi:hypothetical protein TPHA_0M00370 [Tetrapisispora phaffii CBS 4417]|uniref:N-terminal acetyltransferase A complex subunit NAT1 n=1 Tax=Tetrapisispora phaffii (strain ATCC 24235 / CBS 4417 / NBRC 1672 / NRRL Y-8282 / UCD 70-5) TaxID=1071381 RepID=G8C0V1_TETPH|nr:hypothetical protein TPHA_0M00370 [Tetrapisispora phaffii CBS 4417]CCE65612.1 hypothetical protein TPHA_0M00370 [Tetrapisispora phaffii CBS 4417]